MVEKTEALSPAVRARSNRAVEAAQHEAGTARTVLLVILVVAVLVAGLVTTAVRRSITAPIGRLVATLRRVADRDLTASVADPGPDELAQIAQAPDTALTEVRCTIADIADSRALLLP